MSHLNHSFDLLSFSKRFNCTFQLTLSNLVLIIKLSDVLDTHPFLFIKKVSVFRPLLCEVGVPTLHRSASFLINYYFSVWLIIQALLFLYCTAGGPIKLCFWIFHWTRPFLRISLTLFSLCLFPFPWLYNITILVYCQ